MSQADKEYISKEVGSQDKIEVVANGVDSEWFSKKRKKLPQKPTVLSVGTFNWLPNVEAVKFLVDRVWPLLKKQVEDVQLWIVGNAPTEEVLSFQKQDPNIKVTGNIPDIRDAFKGAHVVAAPVFSGKGTRYKILEAMAAGTPVVATSIAVEGLGVKDGKHVLLADTAAAMTDKISRLLKNPNDRNLLSRRAKKFVTSQYDWKYISTKLDQVYQEFS